jgi:hypothetical protein
MKLKGDNLCNERFNIWLMKSPDKAKLILLVYEEEMFISQERGKCYDIKKLSDKTKIKCDEFEYNEENKSLYKIVKRRNKNVIESI